VAQKARLSIIRFNIHSGKGWSSSAGMCNAVSIYGKPYINSDFSMINWQVFGRKRSWPNRATIPAFFWTEHEIPHSKYPISRPGFKINTSGMLVDADPICTLSSSLCSS
jgi:hypothetical protein